MSQITPLISASQALKVALMFNEHKFVLENDKVSLVHTHGPTISQVLPDGYFQHDLFVANPWGPACLQNQDFKSAFDLILQDHEFNAMSKIANFIKPLNSRCPNASRPLCRDQVSARVIDLAGVAQLLFGAIFPCFDEKNKLPKPNYIQ